MPKVQVRTKKIKLGDLGGADLGMKFLNGEETSDKKIIAKKMKDFSIASRVIVRTLDIIVKGDVFGPIESASLSAFAKLLEGEYMRIPQLIIDSEAWLWSEEMARDAKRLWDTIKASDSVKKISASCANLKELSRHFSGEQRNVRTLYNNVYGAWRPLVFAPELDLKAPLDTAHASIIMSMLDKVWTHGMIIHRSVSSPDFDIDELVSRIPSQMQNLLKVPELSRCQDAIKYIQKSANLMKDNFEEYYKDYSSGGNPASFMHSFLNDVIKSGNIEMKVVAQLTKIIKYYQKTMGDNALGAEQIKLMNRLVKHAEKPETGSTSVNLANLLDTEFECSDEEEEIEASSS